MASSDHNSLLLLHALIVAVLLVPRHVAATDVEYCKKGANYPVKVSGVDISPNPVARGQPAKFSIKGTSGNEISKGKLVIDVKYFGFHVHEETHDLCEETSCPVSGNFVIAHEQTLPIFTPPGSYTLTMKMSGEDGKLLTCITFGFSIGFLANNELQSF